MYRDTSRYHRVALALSADEKALVRRLAERSKLNMTRYLMRLVLEDEQRLAAAVAHQPADGRKAAQPGCLSSPLQPGKECTTNAHSVYTTEQPSL